MPEPVISSAAYREADDQEPDPRRDEAKRCKRCCQIRPLSDFRKIRPNQEYRRSMCRTCCNEREREKTELNRLRDTHRYAARVNQLANEQKLIKMMTVTAQMIKQFRSLDEFVETWKRAIDTAQEQGRHATACRSMTAIMHLVVASTALRDSVTPLDLVDDDDLAREFEQMAARLILEHPELAVAVIRPRLPALAHPTNENPDSTR